VSDFELSATFVGRADEQLGSSPGGQVFGQLERKSFQSPDALLSGSESPATFVQVQNGGSSTHSGSRRENLKFGANFETNL
jgi:hypothetical protein